MPLSYSWGILLPVRKAAEHQELHRLPRVTWFVAHLHRCPLRNHLQPECQTVFYANDPLVLSKLCRNSHGQAALFLHLLHRSFFPHPNTNENQPAVFFLTHLEFAATICACHPNGALALYTLVKCLAKKSSFPLSTAFYSSECYGSSYVPIYSNQDIFCLSQQTSTGDEYLQIQTTTLLNFTLTSCHRLCWSSENNQKY